MAELYRDVRPLEQIAWNRRAPERLFALDSFGGGFVTQAFLAYWFTETWGTSAATLGVVFFAIGFLQAASFQIAVRLAGRIGLLNTMVFTHLPSNLLLALIPFAPSQASGDRARLWALRPLSDGRSDPPGVRGCRRRTDERTAAASYTNTARYVVRPLAPLVSGPILAVSLSAPFVIAGALKSVYDAGLYALFRHVAPEHEDPLPPSTVGARQRGRVMSHVSSISSCLQLLRPGG